MNTRAATLITLSPELIQEIGYYLTRSEVKRLRLTCCAMAGMLSGPIFRTISLKIDRRSMTGGVQKVMTLATNGHAAGYAARNLIIGVLSPVYNPYYNSKYDFKDGEFITLPPPEVPPEVISAEEQLTSHLLIALTSLKGVRNVKWEPHIESNPATHRIIMDALSTLPNLRRLEIRFSDAKFPLELDLITGLEELVISTTGIYSPSQQDRIFENLAKGIPKNPRLTSIDVTVRPSRPIQYYSLHHLFKYYPVDAPPLHILSLKLDQLLLRLDDITLPHLAHLDSLNLSDIDDPYIEPTRNRSVDQSTKSMKQKILRDNHGSSLNDIWKVLQTSRIHLKTIKIHKVSSAFFDYISSYSGLRVLNVQLDSSLAKDLATETLAVRFYDGLLESHAQTLEVLRVTPFIDGQWCFGYHSIGTVPILKKLKFLNVAIKYSDLKEYDANFEPIVRVPFIKTLMDTILTNMPDIQGVELDSAQSDEHFRERCVNPHSRPFAPDVIEYIDRGIRYYISPPFLQRVPILDIGKEAQFTGHRVLNSPDDPNVRRDEEDCVDEELSWGYFKDMRSKGWDPMAYWRNLVL